MSSNQPQPIPFSRAQALALQRLAAQCKVPAAILIARAVGEFLNTPDRGRPVQLALPFDAEVIRLAAVADAAIARYRSAARKRAPQPLVAAEPTRVM